MEDKGKGQATPATGNPLKLKEIKGKEEMAQVGGLKS